MQTRRLSENDFHLAQALVQQFHEKDVAAPWLAKLLANRANFLLVAEADGQKADCQLVGFLLAHELDDLSREAPAMFIYEIEVTADARRQGVGAALMRHIRRLAEERGMFEMFVFTNHANSGATAFYRATGGQIEDGDELMFVYPLLAPTATTETPAPR